MTIETKTAKPQANTRPVAVHLDTKVEELEQKIAPGRNLNHNETFVTDRSYS